MKKFMIVFMSLLVSNATLAAAVTHLSLDNRTGLREVPDTGVNLRYDASWYAGGRTAYIIDNGETVVSGAAGNYSWNPARASFQRNAGLFAIAREGCLSGLQRGS